MMVYGQVSRNPRDMLNYSQVENLQYSISMITRHNFMPHLTMSHLNPLTLGEMFR